MRVVDGSVMARATGPVPTPPFDDQHVGERPLGVPGPPGEHGLGAGQAPGRGPALNVPQVGSAARSKHRHSPSANCT